MKIVHFGQFRIDWRKVTIPSGAFSGTNKPKALYHDGQKLKGVLWTSPIDPATGNSYWFEWCREEMPEWVDGKPYIEMEVPEEEIFEVTPEIMENKRFPIHECGVMSEIDWKSWSSLLKQRGFAGLHIPEGIVHSSCNLVSGRRELNLSFWDVDTVILWERPEGMREIAIGVGEIEKRDLRSKNER